MREKLARWASKDIYAVSAHTRALLLSCVVFYANEPVGFCSVFMVVARGRGVQREVGYTRERESDRWSL